MKEKSLIAQRIIHDKIVSDGGKVSEFDISSDLRKSCMLASHPVGIYLVKVNNRNTRQGVKYVQS